MFFTVIILYHAMRDKSIGIAQKTHAMRDFVGVHKILQFVLYILFYKKQAAEFLGFPYDYMYMKDIAVYSNISLAHIRL